MFHNQFKMINKKNVHIWQIFFKGIYLQIFDYVEVYSIDAHCVDIKWFCSYFFLSPPGGGVAFWLIQYEKLRYVPIYTYILHINNHSHLISGTNLGLRKWALNAKAWNI